MSNNYFQGPPQWQSNQPGGFAGEISDRPRLYVVPDPDAETSVTQEGAVHTDELVLATGEDTDASVAAEQVAASGVKAWFRRRRSNNRGTETLDVTDESESRRAGRFSVLGSLAVRLIIGVDNRPKISETSSTSATSLLATAHEHEDDRAEHSEDLSPIEIIISNNPQVSIAATGEQEKTTATGKKKDVLLDSFFDSDRVQAILTKAEKWHWPLGRLATFYKTNPEYNESIPPDHMYLDSRRGNTAVAILGLASAGFIAYLFDKYGFSAVEFAHHAQNLAPIKSGILQHLPQGVFSGRGAATHELPTTRLGQVGLLRPSGPVEAFQNTLYNIKIHANETLWNVVHRIFPGQNTTSVLDHAVSTANHDGKNIQQHENGSTFYLSRNGRTGTKYLLNVLTKYLAHR